MKISMTIAASTLVLAGTAFAQSHGAAWKAPRTPWGQPDLQGIWDSKTITSLERPSQYTGREFLTDEEVAALERKA